MKIDNNNVTAPVLKKENDPMRKRVRYLFYIQCIIL